MNKFLKISDTKNHKLLIIFIISLFIVSCSDPEVSLEKITISGEISIAETIEMNQPINLSIKNQPMNQSMDQSMNQSMKQPMSQSMNQSMIQ